MVNVVGEPTPGVSFDVIETETVGWPRTVTFTVPVAPVPPVDPAPAVPVTVASRLVVKVVLASPLL